MLFNRSALPRHVALLLLLAFAAALPVGHARAQGLDPVGRPIIEVRLEGLEQTPETLVRNQLRTTAGGAYDEQTVNQDIVRLTQLGRFELVEAAFENNGDGSIDVIFRVVEQPTLSAIYFKGAKSFGTTRLLTEVLLRPGDPIDRALIDRGARSIEKAYEDSGYFAATATYSTEILEESRELVYTIVEGPRVRVVDCQFEGNVIIQRGQLEGEIRSREYFWPFYDGYLNQTLLDVDVASIRDYYRNRGYLEAQVGKRIDLSPRQDRAIVTFLIDEGPQYRVNDINVRFTREGQPTDKPIFTDEQIKLLMNLLPGEVFSEQKVTVSQQAVEFWYGNLGYLNTAVVIQRLVDRRTQQVNLIVNVDESTGPTILGKIEVIGNTRTDRRVLLRRMRGLEPGRPINLAGLEQTRSLIRESTWFTGGTITLLGQEGDPVRDILIEVNEKNTGSFNIGAGISSDSGVFGTISLEQRNFDINDVPESWDEFASGKAFLGAGQTFNITLAPGNQNSNYSIGFREPYLFETDYFFDFRAFALQSEREDYDEGRIGVRAGIGRRLGDVWTGSINTRIEQVSVEDIEPDAPVDVFAVQGDSILTVASLSLTRSRTDSNVQPSRGNRLTFGVDQYGVFGGDFDFTRVNAGYAQFWTLDEDYLGRKSILSLKTEAGYILQDLGDVPLFERYYAGGRDFRGFGFRGVGPRGIRNDTMLLGDDPVGGRFQFLTRVEYEMPLYDQFVRWAVFSDQGTVQDDFGFDQWRVSVGTGIRFVLPFFGQAPFAIDFAIPLQKEQGDDTQIFSFDVKLPFN